MEALRVIRAAVLDGIRRQAAAQARAQLLQAGLRIHRSTKPIRVIQQRLDQSQHKRGRGRSTTAQIDGADDRLDGVGKDG